MPKKIKISQIEKNIIVNLYKENNLSSREIGKLLNNKSQSFIERILKEEGVYKNFIGNITIKKEEKEKIILKKDFIYIAKCKKTGKEFEDYKNSSGILTEHLKNNFKEIIHPSNYKKRNYKLYTGKYWHEQYFDIIEKKIERKQTKKCCYCNWTTIDLKNKSGMYLTHLRKEHNISIKDHLIKFPGDKKYFKNQVSQIKKEKILKSSSNNHIFCKICNKRLKYLTNSHLKLHNITMSKYKLKFYKEKTISNNYLKKLQKKYKKTLKYCSNTYTSNAQIEIINFLQKNNITCEKNNKKILNGIEIDIFSNEYKIGIEYNGNFYHTEIFGKKYKNYHLNKTKLMNDKGYKLIHIFEDEWILNKELIKNKLLHIFKKDINKQKIYARNCIIKQIDFNLKNIFLNKNHIQGEDRSNVYLGAYYNDILVAVMTFDKNRQMNKGIEKNSYELKRFCTLNEYNIIGIAGKLISFFVKNYNPLKIISFADRRWTLDKDNNLYTKIGFKLIKTLCPDYSYYNPKINRYKRFHKFGFGKSSLKKKFTNIYDNKKTEWQMMQELGYDRIWDCGKFKYELKF